MVCCVVLCGDAVFVLLSEISLCGPLRDPDTIYSDCTFGAHGIGAVCVDLLLCLPGACGNDTLPRGNRKAEGVKRFIKNVQKH